MGKVVPDAVPIDIKLSLFPGSVCGVWCGSGEERELDYSGCETLSDNFCSSSESPLVSRVVFESFSSFDCVFSFISEVSLSRRMDNSSILTSISVY